jgi:fatty acid kinase fatty acid binding subunit
MKVGIVSDSTCYLPADLTPEGLRIVPVSVVLDGRSYDEGTQISLGEVAAALRRKADISTSRPSPTRFAQVYSELVEEGSAEIVSVHLSADMSGTYDAACLAARDARVPVHVVDSRTVATALGFAVRSACQLAAEGGSGADVAEAARARAAASRTWIVVDSLEQLRRGGRIGAAQALVGGALKVKPILWLSDGMVAPLEKQRTMGRAIARLAEIAGDFADDLAADVIVQHCDAQQRADDLAERLTRQLPKSEIRVAEVGAVISAHVGLGTVSLAVCPR